MLTHGKSHTRPFYRPLLRNAFRVFLKKKFLWSFAFFATLLGVTSEAIVFLSGYQNFTSQESFVLTLQENIAQYQSIFDYGFWNSVWFLLTQAPVGILIQLVIGAIFFVVLIILVIASQGALVFGLAQIIAGKAVTFKESCSAGCKYFGKVFHVTFLGKVLVWSGYTLVGIPIFILFLRNETGVVFGILSGVFFLVFIPIAVAVTFVMRFATIGVVTEGSSVAFAFARAGKMLRGHWLAAVEFAAICLILDTATLLLVRLGTEVLALPFAFVVSLLTLFGIPGGGSVFIGLWLISVVLFGFVCIVGLTLFQTAGWILFYNHVASEPYSAKIERIVGKILNPYTKESRSS